MTALVEMRQVTSNNYGLFSHYYRHIHTDIQTLLCDYKQAMYCGTSFVGLGAAGARSARGLTRQSQHHTTQNTDIISTGY